PVVDDKGVVVGLLSEGDLLRRAELGTEKKRGSWRSFFTGTATLAGDYVREHGTMAQDLMTRDVIAVQRDTDLAEIADLMESRCIKRVPVLDGGRLVGIISRSNLLRALASLGDAAPASTVATDDSAISAALNAELAHQSWRQRTENSVVVSNGVAHLWGVVWSREESRALEIAAAGVPGVRDVQNHLVVLSEEPTAYYPGGLLA
ncbi:MAG TPA: CBS domain-containing protein, partial [Acetobacteraceae bacterium]